MSKRKTTLKVNCPDFFDGIKSFEKNFSDWKPYEIK